MEEGTIISKMTFYDIVTLIVPSSLVCYVYNLIPLVKDGSWIVYAAQFGIIMMFGFILKRISAWWGGLWFRNNTDVIKEEREKYVNIGGENSICPILSVLFFDPLKYILSFIMVFAYAEDSGERKDYLEKYTKAYKDVYSGKRIETLESHVAFLQTWILALFISLFANVRYVCMCDDKIINEWSPCVLLLLCYVCIVTMLYTQRTIYRLVFEAEPNQKK